jgi:hypothetical protein
MRRTVEAVLGMPDRLSPEDRSAQTGLSETTPGRAAGLPESPRRLSRSNFVA